MPVVCDVSCPVPFMNNVAAGALVLPIAMEAARRTHIYPSKLLIPVAYGSLLGGTPPTSRPPTSSLAVCWKVRSRLRRRSDSLISRPRVA